jgi:hypothetical protein
MSNYKCNLDVLAYYQFKKQGLKLYYHVIQYELQPNII